MATDVDGPETVIGSGSLLSNLATSRIADPRTSFNKIKSFESCSNESSESLSSLRYVSGSNVSSTKLYWLVRNLSPASNSQLSSSCFHSFVDRLTSTPASKKLTAPGFAEITAKVFLSSLSSGKSIDFSSPCLCLSDQDRKSTRL